MTHGFFLSCGIYMLDVHYNKYMHYIIHIVCTAYITYLMQMLATT